MSWQVILAIVIVVPIILIAVAFVWYINVSGLYRVVQGSRRQQRRKVQAKAMDSEEAGRSETA